ncbi:hypothetical protein GSI_11446 [Ganoderma sinense ZZ0214-1]|uniref:Uncharacterized protein n=1 Tax=Ganoderma sinense ZZ0214-1 TaxID=1077348 RepID=A0A2G8RVZ6_9APHY|nr:hypothetical protein GSI_11446 [Ganoderma sinense ZZ0214-1]
MKTEKSSAPSVTFSLSLFRMTFAYRPRWLREYPILSAFRRSERLNCTRDGDRDKEKTEDRGDRPAIDSSIRNGRPEVDYSSAAPLEAQGIVKKSGEADRSRDEQGARAQEGVVA